MAKGTFRCKPTLASAGTDPVSQSRYSTNLRSRVFLQDVASRLRTSSHAIMITMTETRAPYRRGADESRRSSRPSLLAQATRARSINNNGTPPFGPHGRVVRNVPQRFPNDPIVRVRPWSRVVGDWGPCQQIVRSGAGLHSRNPGAHRRVTIMNINVSHTTVAGSFFIV